MALPGYFSRFRAKWLRGVLLPVRSDKVRRRLAHKRPRHGCVKVGLAGRLAWVIHAHRLNFRPGIPPFASEDFGPAMFDAAMPRDGFKAAFVDEVWERIGINEVNCCLVFHGDERSADGVEPVGGKDCFRPPPKLAKQRIEVHGPDQAVGIECADEIPIIAVEEAGKAGLPCGSGVMPKQRAVRQVRLNAGVNYFDRFRGARFGVAPGAAGDYMPAIGKQVMRFGIPSSESEFTRPSGGAFVSRVPPASRECNYAHFRCLGWLLR